MTTAIVVTVLALLALGIVINGLLRLKRWLNDSPAPEALKPPDEV
ncbi:hypothetical protein [Mycobacterium angelicum]|nr:hypothetical protein [Mycobacterium angelicum]